MSRVEYRMNNGRNVRRQESWIEIHLAGDVILEDLIGNELTQRIVRKVQRGEFVRFSADVLTSTRFDLNTSEIMRIVPSPFWGAYRGYLSEAEEVVEAEFRELERIMENALSEEGPSELCEFGTALKLGAEDWEGAEPTRQRFDWDRGPGEEPEKVIRRNERAYCLICNKPLPLVLHYTGSPPGPEYLEVPGGSTVMGWRCDPCRKEPRRFSAKKAEKKERSL